MTQNENNRYGNPYVPAPDWDQTPVQPVKLDSVMTTRDILPIVRQLYGIQNMDTDTFTLPRNWASNNTDIVEMFFTGANLSDEIRIELGF